MKACEKDCNCVDQIHEQELKIALINEKQRVDHKRINRFEETQTACVKEMQAAREEIQEASLNIRLVKQEIGSHIKEGDFWRKFIVGTAVTALIGCFGVVWSSAVFYTNMNKHLKDRAIHENSRYN